MSSPAFSDIQQAQAILKGVAHVTPIVTSRFLNHASGATVFLKCENFQRVGAFKFRGAYHAVARLDQTKKTGPVIALSSGNHAQGVALASRLHGLKAHIVMPEPINRLKLEAVQGYGATVHISGNRAQAEKDLRRLVEELKGHFIHAFNDPFVIAGQGTAALEFLDSCQDLHVLLAPVGGGGLLSGTCLAAHGINPGIKIYACEPVRAMDAIYSIQANKVLQPTRTDTIADGLRTSLGNLTLAILRDHLEGFFVVEEQEIIESMRVAFERLKIVIEPSSAVALAPLLRGEPSLRGKRVGVILTGGNVDLSDFFQQLSEKFATDEPPK